METIIKRAIEGGWKEHFGDKDIRMVWNDKTGWWYEWDSEDEDGNFITLQNPCCYDHIKYQYPLVLNSNFWQSLGKACIWGKKSVLEFENIDGWFPEGVCTCCTGFDPKEIETWQVRALQFHQINLTEGWDAAVKWLNELICK